MNINMAPARFIIIWSKHLNPSQATSLVIREMQIRTMMSSHFTPTRMASLKQNVNNKTKKQETRTDNGVEKLEP